ncbi:TlpA disulfide reductase family protein [Phenylobacterium sp.]|uniref:TlpA disulfide reductase family protein n=1 Tax=Phenylobacterium sp. TaxID=1871053 RepID=UPI00122833EC|nr:TlpA disulfide reductase family protein [Phenylobacterium sp.]THD60975.1 MAG: TlpA family protein disulfide reductase [Phenylobacterium sp.]
MATSRRAILAGLAASAYLPGSAGAQMHPAGVAWSDRPAFGHGPLAANRFAQIWRAPAAETFWPEAIPILGRDGPLPIKSKRGKTLLVTLWAEWCAPCLAEMPILSAFNKTYAGPRFEIVPIATGSKTLKTWTDAQARVDRIPGASLSTLIDGSRDGAGLEWALARMKVSPEAIAKLPPGSTIESVALPCLLIVDPQGRLRARYQGGPGPGAEEKGPWGPPEGPGLIKALAEGAVWT